MLGCNDLPVREQTFSDLQGNKTTLKSIRINLVHVVFRSDIPVLSLCIAMHYDNINAFYEPTLIGI